MISVQQQSALVQIQFIESKQWRMFSLIKPLVNSYDQPKEGFSNYWTWLAKATIENTHDLYFGVKKIMQEGKQVNTKMRQLCTGKLQGTYHIKWKEIVESFREDFGIPEPKEYFISKLDEDGKIE